MDLICISGPRDIEHIFLFGNWSLMYLPLGIIHSDLLCPLFSFCSLKNHVLFLPYFVPWPSLDMWVVHVLPGCSLRSFWVGVLLCHLDWAGALDSPASVTPCLVCTHFLNHVFCWTDVLYFDQPYRFFLVITFHIFSNKKLPSPSCKDIFLCFKRTP